jgi:hypothetical protein
MAVFSSSTMTASMFRPNMTDTAVSYLRWVGLHRSTTRPRTPENGQCVSAPPAVPRGNKTYRGIFSADCLMRLSAWLPSPTHSYLHQPATVSDKPREVFRWPPSRVACASHWIFRSNWLKDTTYVILVRSDWRLSKSCLVFAKSFLKPANFSSSCMGDG